MGPTTILIFLLLAVALPQVFETVKRLRNLVRIEAKLDLLLKQAGVEFDPFASLPHDVVDALRRGKKIEAIKRYRDHVNVGLKEAKGTIEEVMRKMEI